MAPHTDQQLQDLWDRCVGANRILFLSDPQPEFEDLRWDLGKISPLLSEVHSNLDQLLEQSNQSGISTIGEVSTWERILSEGTNNHEHENYEGVAEVQADAMRSLNQPLTKQMLCDWHHRLFSYDVARICPFPIGEYRGVEVGPIYFDDAGFVATSADHVEAEMGRFLTWFNITSREIDPLLRVAIGPLWFLTVHPFGNGNGRIGRAIAEMALAEVNPRIQESFGSIARQLVLDKDDYVKALGKGRGTSDITEHLVWFLGCINRALLEAKTFKHKKFYASLKRFRETNRRYHDSNAVLDQGKIT
jgi:Fic family protein